MSIEVKSIHIIKFSGKKTDWESWFMKFLLCSKHKWCKKLLVISGSVSGVKYNNALVGDTDLNKNN